MDASQLKVSWEGEVVSVQPRSTVWRYLVDNRTHREIGYNVFVKGEAIGLDDGAAIELAGRGGSAYDFCVAISEKQQEKLGFQIGDRAKGTAWTPLYPNAEFADLYRAGALKVAWRAVFLDVDECAPKAGGAFSCKRGPRSSPFRIDPAAHLGFVSYALEIRDCRVAPLGTISRSDASGAG